MPTLKTALVLGYNCNNNCIFCYAGDKRGKYSALQTEEVKRQIDAGIKRGSDFVDFLGGEPTIRKDIIELVAYAKKAGFKQIGVTTNGRMFSKKDFAEAIFDAGLSHAIFSIHGHTAELHDSLTRAKGSFEQAISGMGNFRALSEKNYICTNTVILKQNVKFLPAIAENNALHGANGMEFIFPHPRGGAYENFESLVPRLEELIEIIPKTIMAGRQHGIDHCMFRYVPFCYMYGFLIYLSEYVSRDNFSEQHVGPEYEDMAVAENRAKYGRVKGPQCAGCKYFNICEGIFKEYAEKRGFEELVPVP
jgi:MoaA/NifB/PqqE/SkfB family radical SAM enzyme